MYYTYTLQSILMNLRADIPTVQIWFIICSILVMVYWRVILIMVSVVYLQADNNQFWLLRLKCFAM